MGALSGESIALTVFMEFKSQKKSTEVVCARGGGFIEELEFDAPVLFQEMPLKT